MPQKQQRRSDMWWRGHNDAMAGDPPNESYYHYYYDYRLAYDQIRREQARNRRQRAIASFGRRLLMVSPIVLLVGALGYAVWAAAQRIETDAAAAVASPTRTSRPTPRPTFTPLPTPTPEITPVPVLQPEAWAVVSNTQGAPLRARAAPGTGAEIQARIPEGQVVRILEGPQNADNFDWWRVEAESGSGWVAAPYLQPIDPPQ